MHYQLTHIQPDIGESDLVYDGDSRDAIILLIPDQYILGGKIVSDYYELKLTRDDGTSEVIIFAR